MPIRLEKTPFLLVNRQKNSIGANRKTHKNSLNIGSSPYLYICGIHPYII